MNNFKYFFNSCEQGFKNEFVIWLYCRIHLPSRVIQRCGREADELVLITSGQVDMFTKDDDKFMMLPEYSIFNDYQILFGLKSNIKFVANTPLWTNEHDFESPQNWVRTMNLESEKMQDLLDLYPETAENLKLRALEKRSIYAYYKHKVEIRAKNPKGELKAQKETLASARSAVKFPLMYTSTYQGPE